MAMLKYQGYSIEAHPFNDVFYAYVGGTFWRADTLPGIKQTIRDDMCRDGAAFLHFGMGDEPRQAIRVPARERSLWWQDRGLSYPGTRSRFGLKIPSPIMVLWQERWRRVYVCHLSDGEPFKYIGKNGGWLAAVSTVSTVSDDYDKPPAGYQLKKEYWDF